MGIYVLLTKKALPCALVVLLICMIISPPISAQEASYYRIVMNGAKKLYAAGQYEEVIRKLEIALFDIDDDNQALAECYVFISLSQYFLKDQVNARENLELARSHLDEEGFLGLGLEEPVIYNLESLWYLFYPQNSIFPGRTEAPVKPNHKDLSDNNVDNTIRALESQIKDNPGYIASYYDLYEAYSYKGDQKSARKTIEKLLKNKPRETKAYYFLGKLKYQERKFKDAAKNMEMFFSQLGISPMDSGIVQEAAAYHILALNARGDDEDALLRASQSLSLLSDENIEALSLSPQDKRILTEIMVKARKCP